MASLTLVGFWSAQALAAGPSSEALFEERRSEAKTQFESGAQAYRNQRYAEAVRLFLAADRLAPSPALSFNIARAYEKLEDTSGALRWYRDYLRRAPDSRNASEARTRVAALAAKLAQQGLQQLSLLSDPVGGKLTIDGRAVGETPYTGELAPGVHRVVVELAGYREQQADVTLLPNEPQDVSLTLERLPGEALSARTAAPAAASGAAAAAEAGPRRFGIVPWLVAGSGTALLGSALVFELSRRSAESSAKNADSQLEFKQHVDSMNSKQTTARVLAGVGGALFVTGGVLLLFNERRESPVAFGCVLDSCAVEARGTF